MLQPSLRFHQSDCFRNVPTLSFSSGSRRKKFVGTRAVTCRAAPYVRDVDARTNLISKLQHPRPFRLHSLPCQHREYQSHSFRKHSKFVSKMIPTFQVRSFSDDKQIASVKLEANSEFQTTFAVPLTCEDCVKDISQSLYKLDGIQKVEADLQSQLVSIEGSAAPSVIVAAIQSTGRDAILRGSGRPNSKTRVPKSR